jgi:hypothetical protein
MKLTPMQLRLAAAYSGSVGAASSSPSAAPAQTKSIAAKDRKPELADRVELSEQAKAHARIRARLVAGRVDAAAIPETPAGGGTSNPSGELKMHSSAASQNAAATGIAVGRLIDAVG